MKTYEELEKEIVDIVKANPDYFKDDEHWAVEEFESDFCKQSLQSLWGLAKASRYPSRCIYVASLITGQGQVALGSSLYTGEFSSRMHPSYYLLLNCLDVVKEDC